VSGEYPYDVPDEATDRDVDRPRIDDQGLPADD
jgi:amidophosphoribosyltransferase